MNPLIPNNSLSFDYSSINKAKLLYASASRYNGGWHSSPHTHYCSELFYVTEGQGQFQIEDEIYTVHAHDLVIVNPNVEHTELSHNDHPLAYIVIGIEDVELATSDDEDDVRFCILNLKGIKDVVRFYFDHILEETALKTPDSEIMCKNMMENLVILLSRQANFTVTLAPIQKKSTRLCITVRQYIDNHFKENISLEMLAELTHVSKYHMVHVFTEEYGISPINYLIQKRIEEGKKLLQTTDYSLSLIGRTLGFSSPSYFSQVFKKHSDITPLEYRKKSRKNHLYK